MHDMVRRSIGWLAMVVGPAFSAAGQSPAQGQQEPIPRELALALLDFGEGMGGADIRVGKASNDIPPELVPPGAQLLGSMSRFDNSVTVLAVPEAPDSAIAAMESRLLASGWTRPPAPQVRPRGGFVGSEFSSGNPGMPDILCRGDEFVTLSSAYRRSGGSLLKLSYNRGGRYSMCKAQRQEMYRSPYEDAPVPVLRAPEGSMTVGGGSGMSSAGSNMVEMSTRLSTRLKPGAVIAHYDGQMRTAGWTSVSDGALDFVAAHVYRKKDDKGREWTATLLAIGQPGGLEQDVRLHMLRR